MIYIERDNHSIVATAKDGIIDFKIKVPSLAIGHIQSIHCFYFSRIKILPVYMNEILISTALMKFLNQAYVRGNSFYHGPLWYTYGQVNYLVGSPTIRCALFSKIESEREISPWEFATYTPEIRAQFSKERP